MAHEIGHNFGANHGWKALIYKQHRLAIVASHNAFISSFPDARGLKREIKKEKKLLFLYLLSFLNYVSFFVVLILLMMKTAATAGLDVT